VFAQVFVNILYVGILFTTSIIKNYQSKGNNEEKIIWLKKKYEQSIKKSKSEYESNKNIVLGQNLQDLV
jgi:hypothetical protein